MVGVQIKQDWPGVDHYLKPDDEKYYTILPFNVLNFPQLKKKKKEKKTWDKITETLSILSEVQFVKDTTVSLLSELMTYQWLPPRRHRAIN